jgi:hypothetical protein
VTVYRVGDDGATIFSPDGRKVGVLYGGAVILPGSDISEPGDLSGHTVEVIEKRVRHYSDKRIDQYADKRVSPTPHTHSVDADGTVGPAEEP